MSEANARPEPPRRNLNYTGPAENSRNKQVGIRVAAINAAVHFYSDNPNAIADPDSEYAQGRLLALASKIERWIGRDESAISELEKEAQGMRDGLSVIRGLLAGENAQSIDAEFRERLLREARVVQ
jgi:hypothetical protein